MPFASVIVPTCRRPELLRRALASVQAQTERDWEAVVVDDGDGDGIAAARGLGDPRIRALPSAGDGQVDARTTAIAAARGRLVCWLDDDDWWDDREHLRLVREASENARARRFLHRGGWLVDEGSGGREPFDHDATPASLRHNNTVLTSSLAYPCRLHEELGPLDRDLGGYCDWDLMLRLCAAGIEPHRVPGPGVCYAVHAANVSADYDAPARRRGFERFAAKHGLDIVIANHVTMHRLLAGRPEDGDERDEPAG